MNDVPEWVATDLPWEHRKRLWAEKYPKHSEIEDRALDVARPDGDVRDIERWRREFADRTDMLARIRSAPRYSPRERRTQIQRAIKALVAASKVLDDLPGIFRRTLGEALTISIAKAKRLAKDMPVPRSGGPQDPDLHVKRYAAEYAFDLLNDYGHLPTLTNDGAYMVLAGLLFEAATGRDEVSIMRQCREYVSWLREESGDPNAFRSRIRA